MTYDRQQGYCGIMVRHLVRTSARHAVIVILASDNITRSARSKYLLSLARYICVVCPQPDCPSPENVIPNLLFRLSIFILFATSQFNNVDPHPYVTITRVFTPFLRWGSAGQHVKLPLTLLYRRRNCSPITYRDRGNNSHTVPIDLGWGV